MMLCAESDNAGDGHRWLQGMSCDRVTMVSIFASAGKLLSRAWNRGSSHNSKDSSNLKIGGGAGSDWKDCELSDGGRLQASTDKHCRFAGCHPRFGSGPVGWLSWQAVSRPKMCSRDATHMPAAGVINAPSLHKCL